MPRADVVHTWITEPRVAEVRRIGCPQISGFGSAADHRTRLASSLIEATLCAHRRQLLAARHFRRMNVSDDFIGLDRANALGKGGTELDSSSAQLFQNLQGLVGELEADHRAMRGGSLQAFAKVKNELFARFQELVSFCRANGMNLAGAQAQVDATDRAGSDQFSAVGSEIGGISSRMSLG